MTENVVAYTSLTGAELPGALTLARTLKARHPAWRLWAVWVDRAPRKATKSRRGGARSTS